MTCGVKSASRAFTCTLQPGHSGCHRGPASANPEVFAEWSFARESEMRNGRPVTVEDTQTPPLEQWMRYEKGKRIDGYEISDDVLERERANGCVCGWTRDVSAGMWRLKKHDAICPVSRRILGQKHFDNDTVNVELRLIVPAVPHYLRLKDSHGRTDGTLVNIADLSVAELEQIGAAWTHNLLEQARKQRS